MAMPKIEFRTQMFRGDWDQVWSQMRMLFMMEGLCRVNQTHLQEFEAMKKRGLVKNNYPSIYRAGVHYETEKNTEIWPDIPSLLQGTMGPGLYPGVWGDCLPVTTLVLKEDYTVTAIGNLVPGDKIMGDGGFTMVTEHAITGEKPILAFELNNGSILRCSPEHRVFLRDDTEKRAEDVRPGDLLKTPTSPFPASISPLNAASSAGLLLSPEEFAWLLGVYVADGWHESPRHSRFSISGKDGHKKEEQKNKVKILMEKVSAHTRWHERYIAINDRALTEYMAQCGGHAPVKHLPSLLVTTSQARSLVEGLAADCSIASSGTLTHGTTSETLALQLRILYQMLGQSVHVKRWDEHGGLGTHPMYRITVRQADDPNHPNSRKNSARVVAVREEEPELCCDITTDTGRFYLPESDVIVHNCEDLACARVAELRELPWHYERPAKVKGRTECADPRFPQEQSAIAAAAAGKDWPGWKKVNGGIRAKPFAKWRRGPQGQYHYHALVYLPDGRLEDPSLVLGMGKEKEFSEAGTAEKLKAGTERVVIQYAKQPDVTVVDPEKPSGYNGSISKQLDEDVLARIKPETALSGEQRELRAFAGNPVGDVLRDEDVTDLDAIIGWDRKLKRFVPYSVDAELRRLRGYGR
jgi:hypothetical protein